MNHFRNLENEISVSIAPDKDGFTGRECPKCKEYFKIQFGTGLKGKGLPCYCPYCGHTGGQEHFVTKEQIEYAQSIAMREFHDALHKELKKMEFCERSGGLLGIEISATVERGPLPPIRYYREKNLETEVVCDNCTLRYSVYGVFAFCPDCARHNSLQILDKNLEVVEKMLDWAIKGEAEMAEKLIENSLGNCVSTLDGFGRELCRLHAKKASNPAKAENVSFQNPERAKANIFSLFGYDLSAQMTADEWQAVNLNFQKRHLITHKMGVVDREHLSKTKDKKATKNRKVVITEANVRFTVAAVRKIARGLADGLSAVNGLRDD